jgi:hypothetical protein
MYWRALALLPRQLALSNEPLSPPLSPDWRSELYSHGSACAPLAG